MKKALALVLALIMVFAAVPTLAVCAAETAEITYTEHQTINSDVGYDYDVTNASIAWVKQANGAIVWVVADDTRSDEEIIAQAKGADPSLANSVSEFVVLKGTGFAETPNSHGSKAEVNVSVIDDETVFSIEGKYSHFVSEYFEKIEPTDPEPTYDDPVETDDPADNTEPAIPEGDNGTIRIDVPLKMAVEFSDGTTYYGGEMKEIVFGQEYTFRMCAVNWDNGLLDDSNGIRGTVVYRMAVVHQDKFLALSREAAQDTERYTVKGIDIIDNVDKKIYVNGDAEDTHLETDVNNFFVAYRFEFANPEFDKKTGIADVVNTPVESLSVNLPAGSTIACKAYDGEALLETANVFITTNSGEGIYDDVYLTSVNDYTWNY